MLVDGFVTATWRVAGGTLTIRPFRPLTAAERDEIEAEGSALLSFLAAGLKHDVVFA
ncbi:MAG: crosslink repair DNA glycosylase YcaQ family protein [Actinoplanes sp.]